MRVRLSSEIRPIALPGLLHSMSTSSLAASLPADGRQYSVITELPLASGRRADLVGLGSDGEIWIIEIKSSVADLRADHKWMDYRLHCDRLFFATTPDVPRGIFPNDAGLMIADAYGAAIICEAPKHRLHPATRRTMMLAFARAAALRLSALSDPQGTSAELR